MYKYCRFILAKSNTFFQHLERKYIILHFNCLNQKKHNSIIPNAPRQKQRDMLPPARKDFKKQCFYLLWGIRYTKRHRQRLARISRPPDRPTPPTVRSANTQHP